MGHPLLQVEIAMPFGIERKITVRREPPPPPRPVPWSRMVSVRPALTARANEGEMPPGASLSTAVGTRHPASIATMVYQ